MQFVLNSVSFYWRILHLLIRMNNEFHLSLLIYSTYIWANVLGTREKVINKLFH